MNKPVSVNQLRRGKIADVIKLWEGFKTFKVYNIWTNSGPEIQASQWLETIKLFIKTTFIEFK